MGYSEAGMWGGGGTPFKENKYEEKYRRSLTGISGGVWGVQMESTFLKGVNVFWNNTMSFVIVSAKLEKSQLIIQLEINEFLSCS